MEPIVYFLTYGCWLVYCWLLTNAKNQPLPPPSRFHHRRVPQKMKISLRCQKYWF